MEKKVLAATSINYLPEECWISQEEEIFFKSSKHRLPFIYSSFDEGKAVLNHLGLSYEKSFIPFTGDDFSPCLVYWNPSFEEYEEITAPLYKKDDKGIYQCKSKHYTGLVPTEKMCDEAKGFYRLPAEPFKGPLPEGKEYHFPTNNYIQNCVKDTLRKHQEYNIAKWVLGGRASAVAFNDKTVSDIIEWNGEFIKTFAFTLPYEKHWIKAVAFFDLNKIKREDYHVIIVELPDNLKAYGAKIAGENHANLDEWAAGLNQLGLNIITIFAK